MDYTPTDSPRAVIHPWSWRKSSYSDMQGDQCVEVAWAGRDVLVRDTKDAMEENLTFGTPSWRAFVIPLKSTHKGAS